MDEIDVKEMLLPLVVLDFTRRWRRNPDYTVTMKDVRRVGGEAWPHPGRLVRGLADRLVETLAGHQDKMRNEDNKKVAHYPGWSLEVLKYLYEKRKITASGHETTDTDPGTATSKDDYSLETYILKQNHYQIELLCNLDQVPEIGALVVVSFPKPRRGSGFPARVFAILP